MFEIIESLRRKPDSTKKRIAFLTSFFLSGTILIVWFTVIFPNFKKNLSEDKVVSKNEVSPISTLGDNFSLGISKFSKEFNELKKLVSSFTANAIYSSSPTDKNFSSSTENRVIINDQ